jgi:DUF4097 and DUF4098 domain-containing protein YvlB
MTILRLASLLVAAAVLAGPSLYGASTQISSEDPCADRRWDDDDDDEHRSHCEVREERLAPGPLNVDAGRNGGIRVASWDENSTRIQAVVQTHARSEDRAREIANGVQIQTAGGQVRSVGPDSADLGRREGWSVSFRINVPRQTDLSLSASNGGITIEGVSGNIEFSTRNGGVRLRDLAGWVHGRTTNGGLNVMLSGQRWDGNGLDVETTNGGVNLAIPDGYSADLETRTVNGGFRTEYPIVLQGELTTRRGITTRLGSGGAPLRVRTTNGGVRITKR